MIYVAKFGGFVKFWYYMKLIKEDGYWTWEKVNFNQVPPSLYNLWTKNFHTKREALAEAREYGRSWYRSEVVCMLEEDFLAMITMDELVS